MKEGDSPMDIRGGRLRLAHWELHIPDTAEVAGVTYDAERRQFVVSFTHDSLEVVPPGATEWPDVAYRTFPMVWTQIPAQIRDARARRAPDDAPLTMDPGELLRETAKAYPPPDLTPEEPFSSTELDDKGHPV